MEDQITKIAMDVLAILIPALCIFIIELLRRKLGIEKLKQIDSEIIAKQELAILAVQFVQQFYEELDGESKYYEASEWLSKQLKGKGLNFESDEIRGLIESSLKMLKMEFKETWKEVVEE